MIVKLTLSYDGTNYCGWQVQNNGLSVQQVLIECLEKLTGKTLKVIGSGRTDAGVHAEGQVASFEIDNCSIPPKNFCKALNTLLPNDIKIIKSERADDNFNARYSAKSKTYEYRLYKSDVVLPLKDRFAHRVSQSLSVDKLNNALSLFVGEKDFKAFCASGSGAKTTIRTVYVATAKELDNGEIVLTFSGNGFLYNMVRIMCGTALAYAEDKITLLDIEKMFDLRKRSFGGRTLPAKALCLKKVEY